MAAVLFNTLWDETISKHGAFTSDWGASRSGRTFNFDEGGTIQKFNDTRLSRCALASVFVAWAKGKHPADALEVERFVEMERKDLYIYSEAHAKVHASIPPTETSAQSTSSASRALVHMGNDIDMDVIKSNAKKVLALGNPEEHNLQEHGFNSNITVMCVDQSAAKCHKNCKGGGATGVSVRYDGGPSSMFYNNNWDDIPFRLFLAHVVTRG